MTFLPIVGRHLRVASRLRRTYFGRVIAVIACFLPAVWVIVVAYSNLPLSEQGTQLFKILSHVLFFYCLFAGAWLTADCLSEEKREGTLGLLFLTDLKGYDVVLGKLAGTSLTSLFQLLAVLPLIGLALLLGGITGLQFARTILVLLNTLFFSLSLGMLVSTLSLRERRALSATVILIVVLTGLPYLLAEYFAYNTQRGTILNLNLAFAVPSPYFAFDLAYSPAKALVLSGDFYESVLVTHLAGWIFLTLSSLILPTLCHQRPESGVFAQWRAKFQVWCYGSERVRRSVRSGLLNRNPFLWLASRDRIKRFYPWIVLALSGAAWMAGYFAYPDLLLDWEPSFVLLMVIHAVFKIWIASEVCARFSEDRHHGGWELLLSSPLTVRQILKGQNLALLQQFGWPVCILFSADFLLRRAAGSALNVASSHSVTVLFAGMILMFWIDSHTLKWVAIWRILRGQSLNRALTYSVSRILLLPAGVWIVYWYTFVLQTGLPSTINLFVASWFGLGLVTDLFFWPYARHAVTKYFRALASGEIEPTTAAHRVVTTKAKTTRITWMPGRLRFLKSPLSLAFIFLLIMGLAGLALVRHSLRIQVAASIERIRREGYPVNNQDLQDWPQPVPLKENAALEINQAIRTATPNVFSVRDFDYTAHAGLIGEVRKKELTALVSENGPALAHLRQAANLTKSRFPVQWNMGLNTPLSYLAPSRNLVEIAAAEELVHLANHDSAAAFLSVRSMLAIPRALANEPSPISQLVRIRTLETIHSSVEHLLAHAILSEAQLDELSKCLSLAEIDNDRGMENALSGLRCVGSDLGLRPPREFFRMALGGDNVAANVFNAMFPIINIAGAHERDLLFFLTTMDDYFAAARAPYPVRQQRYKEIGQRIGRVTGSNTRFYLSSLMLSLIGNTPTMVIEACARIRICEVAVAIERYRLREGKLPNSLDLLAGLNPSGTQIDPFTGETLRYKQITSGYLLYSVGRNCLDDDGDTSLDIVFIARR